MRKYRRYKLFSKLNLSFYYLRILKFKKTKWKQLQKVIKNIKLKKFIVNHKQKLILFNIWDRIKLSYKNKLKVRQHLKCRYDVSKISFKNFLDYSIKQEFTLSTCLWHINMFKTLYETNIYISRGLVLVNNIVCNNFKKKLYCGDIISFKKDVDINLTHLRINNEIFLTYLEIDYYLKIIVVIKDLKKLNFKDLSLLLL